MGSFEVTNGPYSTSFFSIDKWIDRLALVDDPSSIERRITFKCPNFPIRIRDPGSGLDVQWVDVVIWGLLF